MRLWLSRQVLLKILLAIVLLFSVYHGIKYFIVYTHLDRQIEPGAVKGYFHCDVPTKAFKNFSRTYPCDFNPRPNPRGPIIVTFINSAWLSLAQNWVCSAREVGILDNVYLVSFEPGVCSHFPDVRCYEHPKVTVHGTAFGKAAYQTLVIERTRVILRLLSCYQDVALVDADITFLKNPLPHLESVMAHRDIVFQADSVGVWFVDAVLPYVFSYICGGFIYMQATSSTRRLWLSVLQYQEKFFWNDQAGLNVCIRHHSQDVAWATLEGQLFPSGRQFFFYEEAHKDEAIIVHANHMQGVEKQMRMIGAGVWCHREYAQGLCNNRQQFTAHCQRRGVAKLTKWCRMFADACQNSFGTKLLVE